MIFNHWFISDKVCCELLLKLFKEKFRKIPSFCRSRPSNDDQKWFACDIIVRQSGKFKLFPASSLKRLSSSDFTETTTFTVFVLRVKRVWEIRPAWEVKDKPSCQLTDDDISSNCRRDCISSFVKKQVEQTERFYLSHSHSETAS